VETRSWRAIHQLCGLGRNLQVPAQRPKRELLTDKVPKPEVVCNRALRAGDPEPLALLLVHLEPAEGKRLGPEHVDLRRRVVVRWPVHAFGISAPTGGRPKDVRVLSALYRHQASRSEGR